MGSLESGDLVRPRRLGTSGGKGRGFEPVFTDRETGFVVSASFGMRTGILFSPLAPFTTRAAPGRRGEMLKCAGASVFS